MSNSGGVSKTVVGAMLALAVVISFGSNKRIIGNYSLKNLSGFDEETLFQQESLRKDLFLPSTDDDDGAGGDGNDDGDDDDVSESELPPPRATMKKNRPPTKRFLKKSIIRFCE